MGRRGPPPKPDRLKVLAGNPGKRPLKKARAKLDGKGPSCPEWLSPEAKVEWRRLAPELVRRGLLTPLDRAAFAGYCQSYAHWQQCQRVVVREGSLYLAANGRLRERPEVGLARKYGQIVRAFAVEFGLTPNARSRLSIDEPPAEEDSEFERWLRRGR
jgi:P27 family predicted phage terminase small subunit